MTSEYGLAKQDIKRARNHINSIISRVGWIDEEYKDIPAVAKWFELFKPLLVTVDDSLITLLHIIIDPKPFNEELEANYGKSNTSEVSNQDSSTGDNQADNASR